MGRIGEINREIKSFSIGWGHIPTKDLTVNMYRVREVDLIKILSVLLTNDYGLGNQFGEVAYSETSKDFLKDIPHSF